MIVADASVIVALYVVPDTPPGVIAAEAVLLKDPEWMTPPLWRSEMRSALVKYVRAGVLSVDRAVQLMRKAEKVLAPTERAPHSAHVISVATETRCSAYDAEYVALALELRTSLVTRDRELLRLFPGLAVSPEAFSI